MTSTPPGGARSWRAVTAYVAAALVLSAAFVLAPGPLAAATGPHGDFGSERALSDAFGKAFVGYWNSGDQHFPAAMQSIIDYWVRYHGVKIVSAGGLTVLLAALGVRLWRAARGAGVVVVSLALASAALTAANIQGALAPYSSLQSLLPTGTSNGDVAGAVGQIRQQLAQYPRQSGHTAPAVQTMVDDFGRYHAVLAVIATIMTITLAGASVLSWRRHRATDRSDRRTRHTMVWFGVVMGLYSLALLIVAYANFSTAGDPAPALLAFYQGGW